MRTGIWAEPRISVNWVEYATRLAFRGVAALLVLYLAGVAFYSLTTLAFPYPMDSGDGAIVNGAIVLANGGNLYKNNSEPPYVAGIYTPLYYAANAAAFTLLGPTLAIPRAISLVSTLLLALVVYRWVTWRTSRRMAALLASACLLTFFPIANWATQAKADPMAVLFSVTGAYLVDRHSQRRLLWLAVLSMGLAFYTKQTQLAAPVAAGIYLLLSSPRRALGFGAAYITLVGSVFAALELATMHSFYQHIVEYNSAQPLWLWRGKQLFKTYLLLYGGYLVLAFWGVLALAGAPAGASAAASPPLYRPNLGNLQARETELTCSPRPRLPLLPIYLCTSLLSACTVVALGSDLNYFIEPSAVISILVGVAFGRLLRRRQQRLLLIAAAILLVQLATRVPSVLPGVHVPWLPSDFGSTRAEGITEPPLWFALPSADTWETGKRLTELVSATAGPLLLELPSFAFLAGHPLEMDDTFVFAVLARAGIWQQEQLLSQLRNGDIALLALLVDVTPSAFHHTRLTDEMVEAIRSSYRLEASLPYQAGEGPCIYIYRPIRCTRESTGDPPADYLPSGRSSR